MENVGVDKIMVNMEKKILVNVIQNVLLMKKKIAEVFGETKSIL